MSVLLGVADAFCLVSNAHSCLAPSIWRRLLMQAFVWDAVRAFTKLGTAIEARRPTMATTIMISTRVKPALREIWHFITNFPLFDLRRERCNRRINYDNG